MSLRQKITLAISFVFYVITIYGFFNFSVPLVVLFFLAHTVSILIFCYSCYSAHNDYTGAEHLQQEIGLLEAEKQAIEASHLDALKEKDREQLDLRNRIQELERELQDKDREMSERIEALEADAKANVEAGSSPRAGASLDGILPAEDGGDSIVDLISITKSVIGEMEGIAARHGLVVRLSSSAESLMVRAGANRLRVLFRNIIDNSIKYMNREGSLVITVSAIDDDIFVVLKDNGVGLAEEETRHVFELNYQGSNRISGNGLGLAQAKAIVEGYGGTIYARSSGDNGFAIYIQIPARVEACA